MLWPKFDDPGNGLFPGRDWGHPEEVFDLEIAVHILLLRLKKYYPQELSAYYNIALAEEDGAKELEEKIGRSRGCLKAGGLVDYNKVIQMVIRDFKTGKLGAFTLEVPGKSAAERRRNTMKIAEVKELLAGTPTAEQLAELRLDARAGVQKLLAAYTKRLAAEAAERDRLLHFQDLERRYWEQSLNQGGRHR